MAGRSPISVLARAILMGIRQVFERFRRQPTLAWFADQLIRGARAAGDSGTYTFEATEGRIVRTAGGEATGVVHLGNMFPTYLAKTLKERSEYLRNCVRSILTQHRELPEDFEAARVDLRPRLWSRLGLEKARLHRLLGKVGPDLNAMPSELVGEHLVLSLGYDWPESVQSINQECLDAWDVTLYEAMEVARQNLREATEGYAQVGEGFYAFIAGDSYDATRIALIDLIERLEMRGQTVAMIPNRDGLLITGSDDEKGLAMMAALAEERLNEPYPMSGSPLILDDGAWVDWLPPEGHSLRRKFLDIRTNWLGPEYTEQQKLLEAIHSQQGIDLFVASHSAIQRADGARTSYAVWSRGIDALLPEVEKVVFVGGEETGIIALAEWDHVRAVVGHRMGPTEHYPPRFRVDSFPDDDEIAALGIGPL